MVKSAHEFGSMYDDLGIDLSDLGCVMLDVEPPDTGDLFDGAEFYTAKNPARFWIDGLVTDPHLTVRYGLLKSVRQQHVHRVLEDVALPKYVMGTHLEVFDSPYEDEPYECVVLRVYTDPGIVSGAQLLEMREALGFLPNVNTFPGYKAHITLGYVNKGFAQSAGLDGKALTRNLEIKGLNYGKMAD